jgi:diguanylate cyclase (GGDEF)-like protein
LDVDNLKIVNDTFGHQAGDDLLKIVAARLAKSVVPHATYRLGGDEFAVLIQGGDVANTAAIAARVRDGLILRANCDGHSVIPTATIGLASVAFGDANVEAVRRHADFALYHAKETDRGGFVDYNPQLGSTMSNRAGAIRDVTLALEELRIDAYYQPIVRLDSRAIVGVEALCRLKTPDGEVVSAASFHEAMSDARIASQLTRRMMAIAASDVRKWLDLGIPFQHVGINISSADFHGGNFEHDLCAAFEHENVSLKHVIVEVTESVYMRRQDQIAVRVIESMRDKGVRVALDDFGTGFASLTDLLSVPIDVLKIDKSFVDGLTQGEASAIIVEGLISIASKLGIRVIAEGVETEAQALCLKEFGCTLAQGYLFSRAVHRDEATAILLQSAQTPSNILRSVVTDDASSVRGAMIARQGRTALAKWQRTRRLTS